MNGKVAYFFKFTNPDGVDYGWFRL